MKQMERREKQKEGWVLLVILTLAALLCLFLWYLRNVYRVTGLVRVEIQEGQCDLSGIDFDTALIQLQGDVEYIPGILTPDEFAAREHEAQTGNPWDIPAATSRVLIKVPDDRVYTLTRSSVDYAYRAYVDGMLRHQAGVPSPDAEEFVPGYGHMTVDIIASDGVIEILQQGANFVHRTGGGHSNLYIGSPQVIRRFLALTFGVEYINIGLFAALFLIHMVLFSMRRSYRPNLIFSLLCLAWLIRTGITNAKVFYALFPAMSWQAAFRTEYVTLPAASVLLVLLAREVFPGVPQPWFVRTVSLVSAGFSVMCLVLDTVALSWMLIPFEFFFTLAILYMCVRFAMKVPGMIRARQFQTGQAVSLTGYVFFMYAAINDALHHLDIPYYLGVHSSFTMTWLAMLIFSFFQIAAMFYGTMQEAALAHEREHRAETEKEMLEEMNRLKNSFYTDISHEMKTPLTVIAINAQFAAQNIDAGMLDEETVTDLNAISAEAKRLAQMVSSLVGIGRMQGTGGGLISLAPVLTETAHIYQSLFARKDNTLTVEVDFDLPLVEGSTDQLVQVMINLLSNANHHTSGGEVSIRTEVLKNRIWVSVTDNGEGIAPDLLPHVFDRFCHGEKGGSGLGLAICKSIIEEHGGEIGMESEEGKGTRVWFTLPVKEVTGDEREGDDPSGGG